MPPPIPPEALIRFNVGGHNFDTTPTTLCNGDGRHSMLCKLATTTLPTRRDATGRIFIDRDGDRFAIILNYLRDGTVHVVDGVVPSVRAQSGGGGGGVALTALREDARFYGLVQLERRVEEEIRRLELEECLHGFLERGGRKGEGGDVLGSPISCAGGERGGIVGKRKGGLLWMGNVEERFTLDAEF